MKNYFLDIFQDREGKFSLGRSGAALSLINFLVFDWVYKIQNPGTIIAQGVFVTSVFGISKAIDAYRETR